MKIVHLMAGDLSGGAARGAYWLHQALVELGIDSTILTNSPAGVTDDRVLQVNSDAKRRLKHAVSNRLGALPGSLIGLDYQYQPFDTGFGGSPYQEHPAYQSADLVHLHHVNRVVSVRSLRRIRKPLVWTLRSMWPLTGGCHYSFDCSKYKTGCSACPQLPGWLPFDLAASNARLKARSYPAGLELVGVSDWISQCARQSALLRDFPIRTIHNGIDTREFNPVGREQAINALGLTPGKRYLLVVAQNFRNRHKGFDVLRQTIGLLDRPDLQILILGRVTGSQLGKLTVPYTSLGTVFDVQRLRQIYSAASLMILPNLMETFGKTCIEAMACGTPVVCFAATGPSEIVEHQRCGYCAEPYRAESLAAGIHWILDQPHHTAAQLGNRARERAVAHFDALTSAKRYAGLYRELLNRKNPT